MLACSLGFPAQDTNPLSCSCVSFPLAWQFFEGKAVPY